MNPRVVDLLDLFDEGEGRAVVAGWVHSHRNHGGLTFIDLRDHSGIVQLVFHPDDRELFQTADKLRAEWVIEASGRLQARPPELENPKLPTGKFELVVDKLRILNRSATPPIAVSDTDGTAVSEEKRLRYRYLDLRRPKMQANLRRRAEFYKFLRRFMEKEGFIEIPTPILANSSPEGARDFLVPSRVHPGKFYALPQAPQQFKQLLMVGGVPRYYQIAAVFRDEDPRADRLYGDFYQLDLEVAFVEDGAFIRQLFTPLVASMVVDFAKLRLFEGSVLEMTYAQAMEEYGTDKPDLRFGLKLVDLGKVFQETEATVLRTVLDSGGAVKGLVAPAAFSRKQLDEFTAVAKAQGAAGLAYLAYQDGQWQGPLAKFLKPEESKRLAEVFTAENGQTVFLIAHQKRDVVNRALGQLRLQLGDALDLKDPGLVAAVWVTGFPFYEEDEQTGQLAFAHNPFSKPLGDLDGDDKLSIEADQFDLVLNGHEVCSGAARNHDPELLIKAFTNLGYAAETVEARFGAMINAFKYGAPPHAGCAFGLDRVLMILSGETNLRELVAFPKNGSGVDVMMDSPAEITTQQRKELGL
ncbi:aspartate--tRNA ligase [Candidatus Saccharibacteria bacterium]|nr:aspartate--tRNA ligase [Candidatus Saccharibacteria bacterium]